MKTRVQALIDDYEHKCNEAYNKGVYLNYVRRVAPELWGAMMQEFDGMAGFTQADIDDEVCYEQFG